jgi:hypothetical protein
MIDFAILVRWMLRIVAEAVAATVWTVSPITECFESALLGLGVVYETEVERIAC